MGPKVTSLQAYFFFYMGGWAPRSQAVTICRIDTRCSGARLCRIDKRNAARARGARARLIIFFIN